MVQIEGMSYHVTLEDNGDGYTVIVQGRELELETDWEVGDAMMKGSINGEGVTVHVSIVLQCGCEGECWYLLALSVRTV